MSGRGEEIAQREGLVEGQAQAAASWKGCALHPKQVVRGREFVTDGMQFEPYLPFAAGFGLGEPWAKHFQQQGHAAVPNWFRALEADGGDFGAVVAALAATNAIVSSADAGAAGASGGGASGAG